MDQITVDYFYEQGRRGILVGLECELGHVTVPPRHSCRVCHSNNLKARELSGRGEIISFTEVNVKAKEFPVDTPYVLGLVQLEEGGNLIGVVSGPRSGIKRGSKVLVKFQDAQIKGKWPRIFFDLS